MDITEEIIEVEAMSGNIKVKENKKGEDSIETENSDKSKSKKRSEPSLDKPNPEHMNITLPLSKSDDRSLSSMYKTSHEYDRIPKKKKTKTIPESLVTAPEVTQDPDGMEKVYKVGSSIEGSKKTPVCVNPLLSLKAPPPYNNKRD